MASRKDKPKPISIDAWEQAWQQRWKALMKLIQQRFKLTAALPRQGEVIEI